jgi:gliding motility-associated-like protein
MMGFTRSMFTIMFICAAYIMQAQGQDPLILNVTNGMGETGTRVCLDVTAKNFKNIESIQFNLSYDATLIVPECPATYVHPLLANNIFGNIFNCTTKDLGFINFVWASDPTTIPDDEVIFTLCFQLIGAPGNSSPVFFNGFILEIEICAQDDQMNTDCKVELESNIGTIMIKSSTLQVLHNKCDADGVNNIENASLTFYGAGGRPPYTYTVTPGGYSGTLAAEGQREKIAPIPQGSYTISITDSDGLTAKSGPIVVSSNFPIQYDTDVADPYCCTGTGAKKGYIHIKDITGLSPFKYKWSNYISGQGINELNDLTEGIYYLTITDNSGCEKTDTFELKSPKYTYDIKVTKNASCKQSAVRNAEISVNISGGNPWAGGVYAYQLNGGNTTKFTPPFTITGLAAGTLRIKLLDSVLCATEEIIIDIPFDRTIDMQAITKDISCHGLSDGEVILTASPYSLDYTFFPVTPFPNLGIVKNDTFKITGLSKGKYRYRLIDKDMCRDTVDFEIFEPDPIKVDSIVVQPGCNTNGSVSLSASGGTPGYTYFWLPGGSTQSALTDLTGGFYQVTVTDANGCSEDASFTLNTAGTLNITTNTKDVSCFGRTDGEATVNPVFSGTIPMFEVIWRDASGNALPNKTTKIVNLPPGNYTVEVIAADGCKSEVKTIIIGQPLQIAITTSTTPAACFMEKGKVVATIAGGTTGFSFAWSATGNSTVIDTDNTLDAVAGNYNVTVTNAAGCSATAGVVITEPAEIVFPAPDTRKVTCFGYSDGAAAIMNLPPDHGLDFVWYNGDGPLGLATKLAAGPGWVVAMKKNGCISDTIRFTILQPEPLKVDLANSVQPTCFGGTNGSVTISASGGTPPFTISWDNGATGNAVNAIPAGSYTATVKDVNNCEEKKTIDLAEPAKLEAVYDKNRSTELDCKNLNAGKIALTTTGGNAGKKTISWQSGVVVENDIATGLSAGIYCATVTDNFGCTDDICITLVAPEPLKAAINNPEPPACSGGKTCISVDYITGGTGNAYTFQINNGQRYKPGDCVEVTAGQYFVSFIDSTGCSVDTLITIDQPEAIKVDLGADVDVQLGLPTPLITAQILSDNTIASLVWTPSDSITCILQDCSVVEANPSETTEYILTVTDDKGCKGSDIITVRVKNIRNVFFPNVFSPNKDGFNDYFQAVIGAGVEKIEQLIIYDRWGNTVFTKSDFVPDPAGTDGWDGTFNGRRLDPGVFIYFASARFIDGKSIEYSGSITLADKIRN